MHRPKACRSCLREEDNQIGWRGIISSRERARTKRSASPRFSWKSNGRFRQRGWRLHRVILVLASVEIHQLERRCLSIVVPAKLQSLVTFLHRPSPGAQFFAVSRGYRRQVRVINHKFPAAANRPAVRGRCVFWTGAPEPRQIGDSNSPGKCFSPANIAR